MTLKQQRLLFIAFSVICISAATLIVLNSLREDIVFFYSPSEIPAESMDKTIRIGGLVEQGSVRYGDNDRIEFRVTDGNATLTVHYQGLMPTLFREGQGMVAEGKMNADGTFSAMRVLAKHDETYMPPEVAESLKKQGYWKGSNTSSDGLPHKDAPAE